MRRSRSNRKHMMGAVRRHRVQIIVLLAAILLPGAFPRTELYAELAHETAPSYKYYTNICVESGETLSSIADRYYSLDFPSKGAYIDEVRFINHLDSDRIYAGELLIVPYFSQEIKP